MRHVTLLNVTNLVNAPYPPTPASNENRAERYSYSASRGTAHPDWCNLTELGRHRKRYHRLFATSSLRVTLFDLFAFLPHALFFWRMAMALPEIRLLQTAIVLAEELHFSRAAERLHVDQSTVSKRIDELEGQLGFRLFERNHQTVEMTEPGGKFVEEAREAILHVERAVLSATAAFRGADDVLNVGKSAYTDPYLVSIISAIRLPLFPRLKIKLWSNYSHELARELTVGELDLALITGIPESPKLSYLKVAEGPFYIAMSSSDSLAAQRQVRLQDLRNRN